jgi:membrane protease YdiL (CAAX protease family)
MTAGLLVPVLAKSCSISFDQPDTTGALSVIIARDRRTVGLILMVVFAPVAEEMLYRGFAYGQLARVMPTAGAVIVQAGLYAGLHFRGGGESLALLLNGVVLGSARAMGVGYIALVLAHMLLNGAVAISGFW